MAQDSWPSPDHNDRGVTDVEYEQLSARFSDDGVYGDPTDDPVVTAGTGLSVNVRSGVYASVRGHVWTSGASTVNLTVAANVSGSTRFDRVILRLDRSTWNVTAVIKQGTPGADVPALTKDMGSTGVYEIPLATVSITASATTVGVAGKELYVGTRVRPCTSISLPDPTAPGELAWEVGEDRLLLWTGTLWKVVYSYSGIVSCNATLSAWTITTDSVLEERNGSVHLRLGSFQRAGALAGADESRLPVLIPAAYRHPSRDQYALAYCSGVEVARMIISSAASDRAGQVWLTNHPALASGDFVLPGSGVSWVVS
ncbi:hypothetical protein [Streptomyces sp. NBC_00986]|uniref:hypothetical protein n=1 Tax=Streptomyces sp. NBC_00986 TaxID=2903702 RepID=UPI003863C0CA|nr:hypothetical protein OG504_45080 [Streptomyces sp. NBC_00986]